MASSSMKYMVRTADGAEYGPVDPDALQQWAEAGRITAECEVRNAMMKKWNNAAKVPFLADIIARQQNELDQNQSLKAKMSGLINPEVDDANKLGGSLNKSGKFQYVPGTTGLRFSAWLFDMAVVGLIGVGLFQVTGILIGAQLDPDIAYTVFTLAMLGTLCMYYAIAMGFMAQTIGHWFWGLLVVRTEGGPVLMGRAFVFSICYVLFGWTTLFFTYCLPSKRALQDILSGVRVVKITNRGG